MESYQTNRKQYADIYIDGIKFELWNITKQHMTPKVQLLVPYSSLAFVVYTRREYFGFQEIPYILAWPLNDRYTSYRASIKPNTACFWSRYASVDSM